MSPWDDEDLKLCKLRNGRSRRTDMTGRQVGYERALWAAIDGGRRRKLENNSDNGVRALTFEHVD